MTNQAWSWNGSSVARTTSLGAAWTVQSFELDPAVGVTNHKPIELLDALIDTTETVLHPARNWTLVVEADVSGLTGSDVECKLWAGWEELAAAFDPTAGVAKLQSTRQDLAAANVIRYLLSEITEVHSYAPATSKSKGLDAPGAYEGKGGYIVYPVHGRTVFPYWIGSALLTLDTAPATAELAVGASTDTVVINIVGARWVGLKVVVGSVSGSVTQWKIESSVNSDVLTVSNAGPFANGDTIDYLATDPRVVTRTDSNNLFTGSGANRMRLMPGSQTLTVTRLAGTGTAVLSLSWPELHRTL